MDKIDMTQIVIALLTCLFGAVSAALVPRVRAYLDGRLDEREIDLLVRLSGLAVTYAQEKLRDAPGRDKRRAAAEFMEAELARRGISLDGEAVDSYLDAAVCNLIRNKEGA